MNKAREFGIGIESAHAKDYVAHAKMAETLGFGTCWVPEDLYRGAFTLASAIASGTSALRIGMGILNPFVRHPATIAMELGALEEISGGRIVLGIGAGFRMWIEGQLGIHYARPEAAMREPIEIVRALFRGGNVTYKGKVFKISDLNLHFRPPRAIVPAYLGVLGPGAVNAGRKLDDFEVCANLFISISGDERAARDAVKPLIAMMLSFMRNQADHPMFAVAGFEPAEIRQFGEAMSRGESAVPLVTDKFVDAFAVAGSPERCRDGIASMLEAGVTSPVAFEVPGISPEKTLRDVSQYLMPHFL